MWQFYLHGRGDVQEQGLAELIFLGISRCALLGPWEACGALGQLIAEVRAEAEAVQVGQEQCKLEVARQWVQWLTTASVSRVQSQPASQAGGGDDPSVTATLQSPGASQPSAPVQLGQQTLPSPGASQRSSPVQLGQQDQLSQPSSAAAGLYRQEETAEREWAMQNSFQSICCGMAPGLPPFKFAQFMRHCATKSQDALQAMRFVGGFSNIGLLHSKEDLLKLADRAETALASCDPGSYQRDGGGDAEHGDGGSSDSSDTDSGEHLPKKRRTNRGRDAHRGGDGNAGFTGRPQAHAVRSSIWWPDEDGVALEQLRDEETLAERARRTAARDALVEYHKALERYEELQREDGQAVVDAAERPQRPKLTRPRVFINGKWEKRAYVPEMNIRGWRTAHLKGQQAQAARAKQRSTTVEGRGDKYVEAGSFYIRRSHEDGEGLCLYTGQALPKGTVVGQYVGRLIRAQVLQRHCQGDHVGSHYVSLRNKASMPEMQNAIDGAIRIEPVDGNHYDLEYFLKNGPSSLANCDIPSLCNCKLMVEYRRYDQGLRQLHIDDEYCPDDIPALQRVKSTS
jgi:hypothetical protein